MLSKVSSFTKPFHSPFRNDIVGSFLRPERLKIARQQFAENQLTANDLKKVEDALIIDLIKKKKMWVYNLLPMVNSDAVGTT